MIGRSEELRGLGRAFERAEAGRATTVLVCGEAGVGKTRLLSEFVTSVRPKATVLVGACLDLGDGAPPYWPVMDALRHLSETSAWAAATPTAGAPGSVQPGAAVLAIDEPPAPSPGPSRLAQEPLFESVLGTLERATARGSLVLIIEDLHWADRSTRDLLTFLMRTLDGRPVMFILSYRSDALVPGHALQGWLGETLRAGADLIEVGRLNRHEVCRQIQSILGGPPRPEVLEGIWTRSEGNAFFAEELLASVVEGSSELPATLRQVLLSRIGLLSTTASQVLGTVAIAGSPVRHGLLIALGILSEADILRAIRECADHQVLVVDAQANEYAFRHSLLRDAVADQLLPAERASLHRACAQALEKDPGLAHGSAAAELALHWFRANDPERALPAAVAAADAAASSFGYAEATAYLQRALGLWSQAPLAASGLDRRELALRAAHFANLGGEHERAVAIARAAAHELGPAEPATEAAPVWERLGRYLWDAGASEDALGAYQRAAELVAADPFTPVGARVLGAQAGALMLAGRYQESRHRAEEALDLARRTAARREEAQILAVLGFDLAYLGDPGGEQLLQEARRIAQEDGNADGIARAYIQLATLLSEPLNRLSEAVAVAEEGLIAVRALGLERFHGVALRALVVNTLFRLGRWPEGDQRLKDAFDGKLAGSAAIDLYLARAKLSLGRGDFAGTAADLETVVNLAARAIDPRFAAPVLTLQAGMALWQGRFDDARAAVAAGMAKLTASEEVWFAGPLAWHGLWAEADRAELARSRRESQELALILSTAEGLMERLSHLMQRLDPAASAVQRIAGLYRSMCWGEWSRLKGASSAEAWEVAAASWDRLEQPYPATYCRWRQAEALLCLRARSAQAAATLRAAHDRALSLGALPLRLALEGLAGRAGIALQDAHPKRPPQARGADHAESAPAADRGTLGATLGLTRRETEVLCLVAAGRTNREVATTLFISEKTASVHVSNILRKLELRSRVEASAVAHRLGLMGLPPS